MSTEQLPVPPQVNSTGAAVLSLHLTCHGPADVITVCGELDISTVHLLDELIDHVVQKRPARVVLDMSQVTFFSAAGLRSLLTARDAVAAAGAPLMLRNPSGETRLVLAITRTGHLFPLDSAILRTPGVSGSPAGQLTA